MGALPLFVRVRPRGVALQKLAQQVVGARIFIVVDHPYLAHVGGELADAAGEKLAAHDGVDTLRFKVAADKVRLGSVSCAI